MKGLILLSALLFLGIWIPPSYSQSCPARAKKFIDYQNRGDRCEGIKSRSGVSSSLRLISFTNGKYSSSQNNSLPNNLNICIPKSTSQSGKFPDLRLQERGRGYIMEPFLLKSEGAKYVFSWSSDVISRARVGLTNLQALAFIDGSQRLYVPVKLGNVMEKYEFIFFAPRPTHVKVFEIRQDERLVYKTSKSRRRGIISFDWDGKKNGQPVSTGLYELYIEWEVEQFNGPPIQDSTKLQFEYNQNC